MSRLTQACAQARRHWRYALYALLAIMLWSWLVRVWLQIHEGGLFRVVGVDFSMYLAQAGLLRDHHVSAIYDLRRIDDYMQALAVYTTTPSEPLSAGPVPYAPVFTWLMTLFAAFPPPQAFALWTAVNLAAVGYLGWRISRVVPSLGPFWTALMILVSFPMAVGLIAGQPTAILASIVVEWFMALRSGRDFRSGLWLSALLIKPQYGVLIAVLLIWKGRWRAVFGAVTGAAVILAASLLLVGPSPLLTYSAAITDIAPWGGAAVASPGQMINWRALILSVRPSIGSFTGIVLVGLAALATVVIALVTWRGPWRPRSWSFAPRVTELGLATALANYHSHSHGLALFALPFAATLAERRVRPITRTALIALVLVPTLGVITVQGWLWRELILHAPTAVLMWSPLVQILLVACLALLVRDLVWPAMPERARGERPSPATAPVEAREPVGAGTALPRAPRHSMAPSPDNV